MSIEIVFETHSLSEDNERGIATGWLPGRLSGRGRANAAAMGRRRRDDGIAAIFTSDLRRAAETAEIAFGDTDIPILYDWRLREVLELVEQVPERYRALGLVEQVRGIEPQCQLGNCTGVIR